MAAIALKALPAEEAVKFFRAKGYQIAFSWQDVWLQEHAAAFTVAKAMRQDVLADIRTAVDKAIADGITFEQFRKELTPILQEKGWWGRQRMMDPLTGKTKNVQLGSPRRLRTIFDANLRSAQAAGRWERIQRTKDRRPWLRYSAVLDDRTRPEHRAWHNTVLPADDPFWHTHAPPNGWNCRCIVQQLSDRELKRYGLKETPRPPTPTVPFRNNRTGQVSQVPVGIDPGWAHNVGEARMRSLAPPPRTGPLPVPYAGPPAAVPMPPPRTAPASRLLPSGRPAEEYVDRFLAEFGATRAKPAVFTDIIGEPVVISEDFFRTVTGRLKVTWHGRERALLLIADAIKKPDEIWWQWEEYPKGRMTLRRRYLARWQVEGEDVATFALFDIGKNGWSGITAFDPERLRYLLRQRGGALAYRRPQDE